MEPAGLEWSIKLSFLRYIGGSGGRASASQGASMSAPNVFSFTPAGLADDGALLFRGDVRFSGHGGLLFVRIAHPRVLIGAGRARMLVDDPEVLDGTGTPLVLVTFEAVPEGNDDAVMAWSGIDVRLGEEGVELFNSVYAPGEPFEDLRISVPR